MPQFTTEDVTYLRHGERQIAARVFKPDGAGPLVARFLDYSDAQIVAAALNTMARLRLKDGNERVRQLLSHSDPIVRANAAR